MANTGVKIVLTLKEINDLTGLPTGNTKPNDPEDPDYIAPSTDLTDCPISFDTTCPIPIITGGVGIFEYEFSIINSVLNNPSVAKIEIAAMGGGTPFGTTVVTLPNSSGNYFGGSITGLDPDTYSLRVRYLDASNTVVQTCNPADTVVVS